MRPLSSISVMVLRLAEQEDPGEDVQPEGR